jgi:hypothetical protein
MEDSVGETPTGATGTVALPRKSLIIGEMSFSKSSDESSPFTPFFARCTINICDQAAIAL